MSVVDDVELDAACINEGVETLSELSDCPTCVNLITQDSLVKPAESPTKLNSGLGMDFEQNSDNILTEDTVLDSVSLSEEKENSIVEIEGRDVRDILFEKGYTIEEFKAILSEAGYSAQETDDIFTSSLDMSQDSFKSNESVMSSDGDSDLEIDAGNETAQDALRKIRIKNVNKILIGTLNINSISVKFDQLKEVIRKDLDILTIQETKLDSSFPPAQFCIAGYSEPYRLDRNRDGGGVLIYVREDIPSKLLMKHNFTEYVEGLFIEINLRKTKLLFFGGYRSEHPEYGLAKSEFLEQLRFGLDKYSGYEKVLVTGDFNIDNDEEILQDFLFEQNFKNLVKEPTCYKSVENPSSIDVFLTNTPLSFQNTITVETGLSDFHKMAVTVMKTTFPKAQPKVIYYRDYKNFDLAKFRAELREELKKTDQGYLHFEVTFLRVLEKYAPMKKKILRANDKPYMTKILRKAIMRRSTLRNKYLKDKSDESLKEFKKHKNYTRRLAKRERTKYFANLDLNNYTDNIKFWNTVKPMFSSTSIGSNNITLVEKGEVVTDDKVLAETFNSFFIDAVSSLSIEENKALLNDSSDEINPVRRAVKKFQYHPSIINIKKHVQVIEKFSFWDVDVDEMKIEIDNLDSKKSGTFMGIPIKRLMEVVDIVAEPLTQIWKIEIVQGKKFADQLKLADITPLHKKLENILKENYRPVSLLPVISKIFEKLMQKQMKAFIESFLSSFLCGYRKGYNTQYALLAMIEKWKKSLDGKGGFAGAILMDLSKAFDTINHELLIAKLEAYGFADSALETMHSYLSDRWQRTKVNSSFSTWKELLCGVPQGSVLGPILFNIYLNDLFYELFDVCNFADDTTLYACDMNLDTVLSQLEDNAYTAILWFENNYMKLNQSKCHFLAAGSPEHLWIRVGNEKIWESQAEKLLGITVDKNLNFESHLKILCKKVNQKVSALARIAGILPFQKRHILLKTFIESQFSYCPLIWMFCSSSMNKKINRIHERALRIVYRDYESSFEELLDKDKSLVFHHRNIHQVAIEMFKLKHDLSPAFMKDIVSVKDGECRTGDEFCRPNVNSVKKGCRSLRNYGPIVWNNMLPEKYKSCETLDEFKIAIKAWKPENCPCELCNPIIPGVGRIKRGLSANSDFYYY